MKSYISSSLTFYDNKIVVEDSGSSHNGMEVMMEWEHPIMSASAAYITQNGGDILEIGFGMGISAGYMHSHSISSHTIIENHPQVIEKLKTWSSEKSNVTIISQSWQEVTSSLGRFDGIFFDDFGGEYNDISSSLEYLTKSGTKMTFWNNTHSSSNPINPNAELQEISVTPDDKNGYFYTNIYYMPKLEF
jgi:predicted O-methyltransferase YrrM